MQSSGRRSAPSKRFPPRSARATLPRSWWQTHAQPAGEFPGEGAAWPIRDMPPPAQGAGRGRATPAQAGGNGAHGRAPRRGCRPGGRAWAGCGDGTARRGSRQGPGHGCPLAAASPSIRPTWQGSGAWKLSAGWATNQHRPSITTQDGKGRAPRKHRMPHAWREMKQRPGTCVASPRISHLPGANVRLAGGRRGGDEAG